MVPFPGSDVRRGPGETLDAFSLIAFYLKYRQRERALLWSLTHVH